MTDEPLASLQDANTALEMYNHHCKEELFVFNSLWRACNLIYKTYVRIAREDPDFKFKFVEQECHGDVEYMKLFPSENQPYYSIKELDTVNGKHLHVEASDEGDGFYFYRDIGSLPIHELSTVLELMIDALRSMES